MENATNQNAVIENTTAQDENVGNEAVSKVDLTQDQLNDLINKKYAKGAEKAKTELLESLGIESVDTLKEMIEAKKAQEEASKTELEKMQEQLQSIQAEKEALAKEAATAKTKAEINALSASNGIKDVEVFEMLYATASQGEGFDKDAFVNGLKETRPYLFGQVQTPKVDNTSNNKQKPLDFAQRVKNAKTQKELDALYAEL